MITKLRWSQIREGDYIWFGLYWRKVIKTYPRRGAVFALKFVKIKYKYMGETIVYYHWDIYKKIKAICKIKKQ